MRVPLAEKDPIEFLVLRRFPSAGLPDLIPPSINRPSRNFGSRTSPETRSAIENYRRELAALSPDELASRCAAERAKLYDELREKQQAEERERHFNQPNAKAEFDYWSKTTYWTLDEALALSFGKAPEVVSWKNLEQLVRISPFAAEYGRRRELAVRALNWKQLYDPVLPSIFLAWAKRADISIPEGLTAAIEKRGIQIADWKSLYEKMRDQLEESQAVSERNHLAWKGLSEKKDEIIARLQQKIETLQQPPPTPENSSTTRPVTTRERESLLKMVIGMAVGGYGFDPTAKRSEQPPAIADDITNLGLSLDVDTVRKWLREAGELLPQDWKPDGK